MPEQTEDPKEKGNKDFSEVQEEETNEKQPAADPAEKDTTATTDKEKAADDSDTHRDNTTTNESSSPEKEKTPAAEVTNPGAPTEGAEPAANAKPTEKDDNSETDQYEDAVLAEVKDAVALAQEELVRNSTPTTELEIALTQILERKQALLDRLTGEISKMRSFVRKRKQTYRRKRKDDGAPVRALSAYNMFIRERFAQLAKENEEALKSEDVNASLQRVAPASLVAKTGNEWKTLPEEIKKQYEEKAKADRERYDKEMAAYQPPEKQPNRKRQKTGYNIFFTTHVLRLKQTESGVPSERGSVARLVGTAWKQLSNDEKLYYEREADKHNGLNPIHQTADDDEEEDEGKQPAHHSLDHQYPYPPVPTHPGEMHAHAGVPPSLHGQPDPRGHHHYYTAPPPHHLYGQSPYHYDYSQHHQRHQGGRQQVYHQYLGHRHPYEM